MRSTTDVLIVLPSLAGGGVERSRLVLAHEFERRGLQVMFCVLSEFGELRNYAFNHFRVHNLSVNRIRSAILPIRALVIRHQPRVVLTAIWPLTVATLLACYGLKTRLVLSDHNKLSTQYEKFGRIRKGFLQLSLNRFYPKSQAIIAVSEGVAKDLMELGKIPPSRIRIINNPIGFLSDKLDSSNIRRSSKDATKFWPPDIEYRLLSVGSLKAQKNHSLLFRALAKLEARLSIGLVILGEGHLRNELIAEARRLGIESKVSMPGFAENTRPFFEACDLFVLSSDYEGLGNVLIEALSVGKNVVATDCRWGPREILADGRYGYLVPPGNADALAEGIFRGLKNPYAKSDLTKRSEAFAPSRVAAQYLVEMLPSSFGLTSPKVKY